ncbi:HD family phosphohydrolase [Metabacillus sp. GX 13764]|uniref:HD family phosphohydrolase n=1 Tax=Metabacillus kandeliae TaxID=2900151 RepID=UPI001E3B7E4F|nr:HD family phosphohydrolase [Metabacillus kandeliae]MCD7033056.1 HD family phosphohydrolase [Metabacillus kandeliae]
MNQYRFIHVLLYTIFGALIFLALFSNVKPETLKIKRFDVAGQTIYAPSTVEDKEATEKKKQEAYNNVEDQYTLKREYSENQVELIASIFDAVQEVNTEAQAQAGSQDPKQTVKPLTEDEEYGLLQKKLPSDLTEKLSKDDFLPLLNADSRDVSLAKDAAVTSVNNTMSKEIPISKLTEAKDNVEQDLQFTSLPKDVVRSAVTIGRFAIVPNYIYDRVATEEKRRQAADSVKEVQIKQGQILVEENQLVTNEVYAKLKLAGLLNKDFSYKPFIGLGLLILLIICVLVYYFEKPDKPFQKKNNSLLLYTLIFGITLAIMKILSLFQQSEVPYIGFMVPAAMGTMLVKLLINERLAILTSIILAICGSIIFNEGVTASFNFSIGVYYLAGCVAGTLFLGKHNLRARILQTGLFVAGINVVAIISILLIQNGLQSNVEIGTYLVMAIASGVAASVLTIGLQPFFETGFGLLSAMKLIELSSPNHPLLRKILTETPGTYHHSVMVANLSESACEAIGANGLLARVGSYYHDIGKTKRPHYFIENQMKMDNPHDKLSPQLSKNVIIAHAVDGADMLRKHKMPKEFIDIAEQHHGTTLLKYFYYKAKERGDEVREEEFRYSGPKPQTREIAVISIADSVEAAVRSMANPTPERIEKIVRGIIADRLQDGQLNECDLTLKELDVVAKSFCESLQGIFHSRIEYPEVPKQKVKQA